MLTVSPSSNFDMLPGVILTIMALAVGSVVADEPQGLQDQITRCNVITGAPVARSAWPYPVRPPVVSTGVTAPRSVGSALSPNFGIGPGESVDLTYDDAQYTVGQGRHIAHWWNGFNGSEAEVDVHFGYRDQKGDLFPPVFYPPLSGYNVYDAVPPGGDWPQGQDDGSELQGADNLGWGGMPSLDIMGNGLVVMGATSSFFRNRLDGTRLVDNNIYYQMSRFSGVYFVDPLIGNVTWIDSAIYRSHFLNESYGTYSRDPQVVAQWDGSNTIVHLLLGEDSPGSTLSGPDYCDGIPYYTYTYFRKVGDNYTGTWSAGQIIDSLWFPWASLASAPFPYQRVAVTYANPSHAGCQYENPLDLDVWCRESVDRGQTWQLAESITNYQNEVKDDPNHFTAWLETQALYDKNGDLHIIWTAKPTSADPYSDGFDWESLDQNLYHWSKNSNEIAKVANGAFPFIYSKTGISSLAEGACGFGGSNAGYIANINISQCNDNLYCIWNQIHERANRFHWRDASSRPVAGVLDDCAYTDERMARANWEIMMSVAKLSTSDLWDMPRNITNTYTPNCGLPGDEFSQGPCGNEYKPSVEKYGFDGGGLILHWPASARVDLSPEHNYSGSWYLNMQYLDDQFPGPSMWGEWRTQPRTENSIKWVRLACVEPVEAPWISVWPQSIEWPNWVKLNEVSGFIIKIFNYGNITLNVTEISVSGEAESYITLSDASTSVWVGDGYAHPLQVNIYPLGLTQTQWLDAEIHLISDAANQPALTIPIHVLAADTVASVVWDTVTTHGSMFDPYSDPPIYVRSVALAVSNFGELGYGARTNGRVNLDFAEGGGEGECGIDKDYRIYLYSGTPFTILASSSDGTNAVLSQVYADFNQADETGFDPSPDKGAISGGVASNGAYDSVYTGKFINRDTTIAMERTVYGPRSPDLTPATLNFVVVYTKVYSADGEPHNHLTFGNVCDFNIPSSPPRVNTSNLSESGTFVYVRGRGPSPIPPCQTTNYMRYGTEAFGGGYTSSEWQANNCVNDPVYYSSNCLSQALLADTTNYRDGTPLVPPQPNPLIWWQETSVPSLNANDEEQDQAVWLTYKHDYNLAATDTLHYWTVIVTEYDAYAYNLENDVAYAKKWYLATVRGCDTTSGCCSGRVGDANGEGEYPDEVTLGDIMLMVDVKFISGDCTKLPCVAEADVDQNGGVDPTCGEHVTLGDIMKLVDFLFITGPDVAVLPNCL